MSRVGDLTQLGRMPHRGQLLDPTSPAMVCGHNQLCYHDLRPTTHDYRISAHPLHNSRRRRVTQRSGWVGTPNAIRACMAPFITLREDSIMKWTKPEAEVVAVTMEVTAYVATL